MASSFTVVLLATIIDPNPFIHLEITPHRPIFFYLSVFGGILAVHGMIPKVNRVFDSEVLMKGIVQYTQVVTFTTELATVVLTLSILWFVLPPCTPAKVDFFHEFTVHINRLGYVCSLVFDFQRHSNMKVCHNLSFISTC